MHGPRWGADMGELEQVSTLIGNIYDAALDPALWSPVLQRISDFVGGTNQQFRWGAGGGALFERLRS